MGTQPRTTGEPVTGVHTAGEIANQVVAAAVWAPSVHNTQPWRFSAHGEQISLLADGSRRLMVADPRGREMMISCGAALFTARLALRALGYIPEFLLFPDPGDPMLVAELSWRGRAAPAEWEDRLFRQVPQRRTHRGGFDPLPLPAGLLAVLRGGAQRDGALLRVVADDGRRAALATLVETAERAQRLDRDYVRELADWVPPPWSTRRDGVPHTSYPARPGDTCPYYPGRDFAHGHGWGVAGFTGVPAPRSAGVVCLLTTGADDPEDWVRAGQALQRVLLTCATCGVAAALHSQPLELGWLRELVRGQVSDDGFPQLILRLGMVIQTAVSVRRLPADVLSADAVEHQSVSRE
jgi:hypothetical protein